MEKASMVGRIGDDGDLNLVSFWFNLARASGRIGNMGSR